MQVLIAEDDRASRRLLEKAVASLGYEVISVDDGLAAWNVLRQNDVRLVIADWEMPNMNGLSLCRRIRAGVLPRYVFVILLTSKTSREDIIEGLEAGADDYLTKPFNRAELSARLRTGLRVVELELELQAKNEILEDLNTRLERMALTDPLMEVGNRRGLYDTLDRLHGPTDNSDCGYSLIMVDVDHFKFYNDTYGHAAGDSALKNVSSAIKRCLRSNDGVFRYGGEEIVVYLPSADIDAASEVANRLCKAVSELGIPHTSSSTQVLTISCGVASRPRHSNEKQSWEDILSLADGALYEAKTAGRNRVAVA